MSVNTTKLKWACRRGMLELDVLLGNFLEEAYPGLSEADQASFVALLDEADPDLFAWLTGHTSPTQPKFVEIVGKIREHARNRH